MSGTSLSTLPCASRDAVSEAAAQASLHAAQMLALMAGLPPGSIAVAPLVLAPAEQFPATLGDAPWLAVLFQLHGGVAGSLALLGATHQLLCLSARLNRLPEAQPLALDALAHGTLAETGNVVASSFLNGLSDRLRAACTPSVPSLREVGVAELPPSEAALSSWTATGPKPWCLGLAWWPDAARLPALAASLLDPPPAPDRPRR